MLAILIGLATLLASPQPAQARRWAIPEAPGHWRIVDPSKRIISRAGQETTSPSLKLTYLINNITWNVTYLDPEGEGFNDTVKGSARRQSVVNVMRTISYTLQYSTGTLDVLFNPSNLASGYMLASADTAFPAENGFYNGTAFEHMTTGVDPDPTQPDIFCTVNFDYPFYAGSGLPAENEYDLESILLHEFTHGLGLISLAQADGTSRINSTNPGVFSVWDSMLQTTAGTSLWSTGGTFTGTPENLAGNPGVVFNGEYSRRWNRNTAPLVYTPKTFDAGSSLSHWDTSINDSIMQPTIVPGMVQRSYSLLDKAALHDLGWQVIMVAGARSKWSSYE